MSILCKLGLHDWKVLDNWYLDRITHKTRTCERCPKTQHFHSFPVSGGYWDDKPPAVEGGSRTRIHP